MSDDSYQSRLASLEDTLERLTAVTDMLALELSQNQPVATQPYSGYVPILSGGSTSYTVAPGPFEPETDADGIVTGFIDPYYQIGGFTYNQCYGLDSLPIPTGIIAVRIYSDSYGSPSAHLVGYPDFNSLRFAQQDLNYVIWPLYLVREGKVEKDLRRMPNTGLIEATSY